VELDGIITFMSSYQALRAERAVKSAAIPTKMVPAPRDLSPTCAVALRFPWGESDRVQGLLTKQNIELDRCCPCPEDAGRPAGWGKRR
jgi:hypothetical protein